MTTIPQWLLDHDPSFHGSDALLQRAIAANPTLKTYTGLVAQHAAALESGADVPINPYANAVKFASDYVHLWAEAGVTGNFQNATTMMEQAWLLNPALFRQLHGKDFRTHVFLSGASRPLSEVFSPDSPFPMDTTGLEDWCYVYVPGHIALLTEANVPVGVFIDGGAVHTLSASLFRLFMKSEERPSHILTGNFVYKPIPLLFAPSALYLGYNPEEEENLDYGTYGGVTLQ